MSVAVTLGSDPEVFVYDTKEKEYIPPYAVLGGDIEVELTHGTLQPDGMALEYTVEPASSPTEMTMRIFSNLFDVERIVKEINPDYILSVAPWVKVEQHWIDMLSPEYGERCSLQMFGCKPDFTPYTIDSAVIKRPNPSEFPWRSSGGHIHLGVGELTRNRRHVALLVMLLDSILGTAVTAASRSTEAKERKKLYGRAGYNRVNEVKGILEYRPLTAQALLTSHSITRDILAAAQAIGKFAVELHAENDETYSSVMGAILGDTLTRDAVAAMINSHDVESCDMHLRRMIVRLPSELEVHVRPLKSLSLPSVSFFVTQGGAV